MSSFHPCRSCHTCSLAQHHCRNVMTCTTTCHHLYESNSGLILQEGSTQCPLETLKSDVEKKGGDLQAVEHDELDIVVALADEHLAVAVGGSLDGGGRIGQ